MSTRARKLGKLRGQAYGASRMANMFARRAMIEADIEKREISDVTDAISRGLGFGIEVEEAKEKFKTAKRGGYPENFMSFLTDGKEASDAVLRGEQAKSISDETFFDVNTNTFKEASTDLSDKLSDFTDFISQQIEGTEQALGRPLTDEERADAMKTAPYRENQLNIYSSMGIDIDEIVGQRQQSRGIFGRLRK
jgi:hypothetical protein|tara:strand:+ start:3463 stop:4044 length:582 start_codon:yes stop_codon:yes gene_type:complete